MKKILAIALLSTLIWSCQNRSSETSIVSEVPSEALIPNYEVCYSTDTSYSEFINGLRNIQEGIVLDLDTASNTYSCPINFDSYFKLFDKLSIADTWKLESHYRHFGDAGRPLILAFEDCDENGYLIQEKLCKAEEEGRSDFFLSEKLFDYQDSVSYLECLEITDDNMGYFQFVVFAMIGGNYCKFWHSNYGEMSIITSKDQIRELTERKDDFYYKFSSEKKVNNLKNEPGTIDSDLWNLRMDKETVLSIDPTPEIAFSKGIVRIRIVTLSPWAGFIRRTFNVSRTFPHKLEYMTSDTLVAYRCGIMF